MVIILLQGRRNMPAFNGSDDVAISFAMLTLSDVEIAWVINFVRSHFGNHFEGQVTGAQVRAQRLALGKRKP